MDSPANRRPVTGNPPVHSPSHRRRRTRQEPKNPWNLRFDSLGTHIPATVVADSPTLLVVAIEDVCWRLAMDNWRAQRPPRWHRTAHRAWQARYQQLDDKRERLQALADEALATS